MATGISWTDETLNFLAGCSKISDGCRNCYAINMAHRLPAMAKALEDKGKDAGRLAAYKGLTRQKSTGLNWTGEVHFIPEALEQPFKWKKPRKIFVNSMSDCFHSEVKDEWLLRFFVLAEKTPRHTYQILTKRPQLMLNFFERMEMRPPDNVWLGVTVENQQTADERIPLLLRTPAAVRFLSCEPLLSHVTIPSEALSKIDWAIIGGESGAGARPCNVEWVRSLTQQCRAAKVAPWVKQMGSSAFSPSDHAWAKKITGKGTDVNEWPEDLRVQKFPASAR